MSADMEFQPMPRRRRPALYLVAAFLVLAVGFGGLTAVGWAQGRSGAGEDATPRVRDLPMAPDFSVTRLDDGRPLSLSGLRGKVVVVNFWGSWCPPCRAEMPGFQDVYQRYRSRGVEFVGIAVNDPEDAARSFAKAIGVTYPLALDPGDLATRYGAFGLPTTAFVNQRGELYRKWAGIMDTGQLSAFIDEALKNG